MTPFRKVALAFKRNYAPITAPYAGRPHSGRYCDGHTPLRTWQESKQLAHAKMLERQYESPDSPTAGGPTVLDYPAVGTVP
jgi:hypothetical protein